ncbi:UNVERIFIED_CONTAM: hypothetical protein FKN15_074972 [Acipenser sinensis]
MDEIVKEYKIIKLKTEGHLRELNKIADELDRVNRNANIAKTAGSSISAFGGVMTIAGLALAPVTVGASSFFAIGGIAAGTAGGATNITTEVTQSLSDGKDKKRAKEIWEAIQSKMIALERSVLKTMKILKADPALKQLAKQVTGLSSEAAKRLQGAGALKGALSKAAPVALSKKARIAGGAVAGAFVLWDVYEITKITTDIRKGSLSETAKQIRKQSCAGPGDVPCDFCTGRKFKAVNSFLTCLSSFCQTHVKPHPEAAAFKRHKLIEATGNLEQKICAEHQKVLEVFCRTDQTCICVLCTDKEHKSYDTFSAEKERTETAKQACVLCERSSMSNQKCLYFHCLSTQEELRETQTELELRIQERLQELEELKQAVESLKRSSQRFFQESEKIFTQLIRSIDKIRSELTELIGAQENAAVNQAEGIMKKLEQEIAELRRRNAERKQLSETEDHIHFLQMDLFLLSRAVRELPSQRYISVMWRPDRIALELMVECGRCGEWFHGQCEDLQPDDLISMEEYMCCICRLTHMAF